MSKKERIAEMARRAMEKRKWATAEASIVKRVKMSSAAKAPVLKLGGSSGVVVSEKLKASTVDAIPLNFVPPSSLAESFVLSSPGGDKGKGPTVDSELTTVNFKIPSNFMVEDTVDKSKIFPHLGKYLLPSPQE